MALSAFDDQSHQPTKGDIDGMLAKTAPLWKKLIAGITKEHAPITEQWNFAGAKYGWSLRLRRRDRVVLYLIPQSKVFLAGIVLGEKAVDAARSAAIRADVMEMIEAAPKYAEGRGIRIPVKSAEDVKVVVALAGMKMGR